MENSESRGVPCECWRTIDRIAMQCLPSMTVIETMFRWRFQSLSVTTRHSHGVAVICTPVGALPDIIEHERTGLIVEPGDVEELASALSRLTEDPDLRRRLGEGGTALNRTRLDIDVCAERLVAIWTESVHAGEP